MIENSSTERSSDSASARAVFLRWERWRIGYNLVLATLVIFLAVTGGDADSDWRRFTAECLLGALVANVCYFAGPALEAYFQWLGFRHPIFGPLLFATGLLLSMALATLTVMFSLSPF